MWGNIDLGSLDDYRKLYSIDDSYANVWTSISTVPESSNKDITLTFLHRTTESLLKNRSLAFRDQLYGLFAIKTEEELQNLIVKNNILNQISNLKGLSDEEALNYIKLLMV